MSLGKDDESHLLASHHMTIEKVEDVVFGVADEDPDFDVRRDGPNYVVMGETSNGGLLTIALEPISSGYLRPFAGKLRRSMIRKFTTLRLAERVRLRASGGLANTNVAGHGAQHHFPCVPTSHSSGPSSR